MKKLLLFAFVFATGMINAQNYFSLSNGLAGSDYSSSYGASGGSAVRMANGNYLVACTDIGNNLLLKTFSNTGALLTQKSFTYTGSYFQNVASLTDLGNDEFIVTGQSSDASNWYYQFYIAKININTNQIMLISKDVTYMSYTKGPKVYPSGNDLFVMFPHYEKFEVAKMDNNLNTKWDLDIRPDTNMGKNPAMDIEVFDSSIIVIGKCDTALGCGDIDTSGTLDSFRIYSNNGYTRIYTMAKLANGNIVVAGLHSSTMMNDMRPMIAVMSKSGTVLWARILDKSTAPVFSRFVELSLLPNGNIIAYATTYDGYNDTYFDGACTFDVNGNMLNAYMFNGYNEQSHSVFYYYYDAKVYNDGILLTGARTVNSMNYENILTFTDDNFSHVCYKTAVSPVVSSHNMGTMTTISNAQANVAAGSGGIDETANYTGSGTLQPTDVCAASAALDELVEEGFEMYPNPVEAGAILHLKYNGNSNVSITDIQGKIISKQTPGYSGQVNTSNLLPGAYLIMLTDNNNALIAVKKLMVK